MSIEPGAIVMRNGRYGYQARIVRGDYAAKREFTAQSNDTERVREVTITNAPCTHLLSVITDKQEFAA